MSLARYFHFSLGFFVLTFVAVWYVTQDHVYLGSYLGPINLTSRRNAFPQPLPREVNGVNNVSKTAPAEKSASVASGAGKQKSEPNRPYPRPINITTLRHAIPLSLPRDVIDVNLADKTSSSRSTFNKTVPAEMPLVVESAVGNRKADPNRTRFIPAITVPNQVDKYFERYEPCQPFPAPPDGGTWPEDTYANDPPLQDVSLVSSGPMSKVTLDGSPVVTLGDAVRVNVAMFDRKGRPKNVGGDLIRVWMKEPSLGASSTADIVDHGNGSYTATLTALWVGKPSIMAALVMSREQISEVFRRRSVCPSTRFDQAVFIRGSVRTETPCNVLPHVVGYKELCNLTDMNYGRAWYCGKPRRTGVDCGDWRLVSEKQMCRLGHESKAYSGTVYQFLNKYKGQERIVSGIILNVTKGPAQSYRIEPQNPCFDQDATRTWNLNSPTGYMYKRKWINVQCNQTVTSRASLLQCVRKMSVLIIGDSTGRQIFDSLRKLVGTSTVHLLPVSKHGGNTFKSDPLGFNVVEVMHELPFCTTNSDRHFFLPFFERMKHLEKGTKTVVLLHMFSHFKPFHSYVFRSKWIQTRDEIVDFLERHPDVHLVIKGPHAYTYSNKDKRQCSVSVFPDNLAEINSKIMYDIFQGFHKRVLYLNTYDITVAAEQDFIHPEDYIVDELVFTMLSYVCSNS